MRRKVDTEDDSSPPFDVEMLPLNSKAYSYSPFEAQSPSVQSGQAIGQHSPKAAAKSGSGAPFSDKLTWARSPWHITTTDSEEPRRATAAKIGDDTAK